MMKTLNEKVYEALLQTGKPITLSELNRCEELKQVPRMALGASIRSLCGEKLVSYRFVNGKMLLSSNPRYGETMNPSREFIEKMGDLSSLFSGFGGAPSDCLGPEAEEEEQQNALHMMDFSEGKTFTRGSFTIGLPNGFHADEQSIDQKEQEFLPDKTTKQLFTMNLGNFYPVNIEYTDLVFSMFMRNLYWKIIGSMRSEIPGCIHAPRLATEAPTGYVIHGGFITKMGIAVPGGVQELNITWNLQTGTPSDDVAFQAICRWAGTITMQREEKAPFDAPVYLEEGGMDRLIEDIELMVNRLLTVQNSDEDRETIMQEIFSDGNFSATRLLYEQRLENAFLAEKKEKRLSQIMNALHHYEEASAPEDKLANLALNALIFLSLVMEYTVLHSPADRLGPYNSAVDVTFGGNRGEGVPVLLLSCPKHAKEYYKHLSSYRNQMAVVNAQLTENCFRILEHKFQVLEQAEAQEMVYSADFKMEGDMLCAYLGSDAEPVIPAYTREIGDSAFRNCAELERLVIPEGVETLGFGVFEGCTQLKELVFPDSLESISGLFYGISSLTMDKNSVHILVPEDSAMQHYLEENDCPYELIKEPEVAPIVTFEDGERDAFRSFSLPVPDGFVSSCRLNTREKQAFDTEEGTAHLFYAAVPADDLNGFSGYKDASFSISCAADEQNLGTDAVEFGSNDGVLENMDHVHRAFRSCLLEKGKVLVRYDLSRQGTDNGVRWCSYSILFFYGENANTLQIFINGDYSEKQCEKAVKEWISGICLN